MTAKSETIRTLNDQLRQNLSPDDGTALITTGVAALGADVVARIFRTIAVYDDFCTENDPYEEHDFGALDVDGHTIFFKIDYGLMHCSKTTVYPITSLAYWRTPLVPAAQRYRSNA